jgi:predicted ATPase
VVVLLTRVDIENFRSIYKASVPLSPFTLLVGANGSGKSNFLKLLRMLSQAPDGGIGQQDGRTIGVYSFFSAEKHYLHLLESQKIETFGEDKDLPIYKIENAQATFNRPQELSNVKIFALNPQVAGQEELLTEQPRIEEDGRGIVRVLDALKTGDREDLFKKIEGAIKSYIPEIEKLSFVPGNTSKYLQVRDKYLPKPILVRELSEGTQLVLLIITLLYQENRPSIICIEDIDRGLHPRLFQRIIELCFDLSSRKDGVQIIATTHNPYLVDEFKGHEEAVLIVEKEKGETTFTQLSKRLENLRLKNPELKNLEADEEPLGSLWYSGFVGGVPQRV